MPYAMVPLRLAYPRFNATYHARDFGENDASNRARHISYKGRKRIGSYRRAAALLWMVSMTRRISERFKRF